MSRATCTSRQRREPAPCPARFVRKGSSAVHGAQIGCRTALAVALLLGSAAAGPAVQSQDAMPQDRTTQLRARFDRESDPVRKAKLMPQLGEEQFKSIREKVRVGQVPEALPTLDQ